MSRETRALYEDLVAHSVIAQEESPNPRPLHGRDPHPNPLPLHGRGRVPSHDAAVAAPVRWKNEPEVGYVQESLEVILGTTYQARAAARSLLNETQGNYEKLSKILSEYKADHKFCDWAQRVGLRAFAFKGMVLTKYHATPRRKASKEWYERNREYINR